MSKQIGVSSSGFYKWIKVEPIRAAKRMSLDKKIKVVYNKSRMSYGSPRIALSLNKNGVTISKTTIARRMASLGLLARPKRKYVHTTDSEHSYKIRHE